MKPIKKSAVAWRTSRQVHPPRIWHAVGPLIFLSLAGCAVGPDFKKPPAPEVSTYTASPLPAAVAGAGVAGDESQSFVAGSEISADWWTLFHSKPLNDLIEEALKNNTDLKAAQAALAAARQNTLAQRGAYYPAVTAGFSATRQAQSNALAPIPATNAQLYNLFTPQVSVSYTPDVFGLNRRTVESLKAQEQATRYQMIAVYNTLTNNVVATTIQAGAVQMQIDTTRQLIDIDTNIVQILEYQHARGYASGLDVAAQKSQLAQTAATLPPLVKQGRSAA